MLVYHSSGGPLFAPQKSCACPMPVATLGAVAVAAAVASGAPVPVAVSLGLSIAGYKLTSHGSSVAASDCPPRAD